MPKLNIVLEFRAAANNLKIIDHKLIKRLRNSKLIDFSANNCTNVFYEMNLMENININGLHSQIYLECSNDED